MCEQEYLAAGIDYQDGAARFLGNRELYERFLREFPGDATFSALEAAMESRNVQEAFRSAHTLKGLTGNLSLTIMHSICGPFGYTI